MNTGWHEYSLPRLLQIGMMVAVFGKVLCPVPNVWSAPQAPMREADTLLQYTSGGHVLGFGRSSIVVASADHMLRVELVGGRAVSPVADPTNASEAAGSQGKAPPLSRVTYPEVWDGVTVVYDKADGAVVKSTYQIQAGTEGRPADQIRLRYNRPVRLDGDGNLVVAYEMGEMTERAPVAWQEAGGKKKPISVAYLLLGERDIGFRIGDYDHRLPVVIDPAMTWSTFLGGGRVGDDWGYAMAVDSSGNVYLAGSSDGTWGSPVRAFTSGKDAFVAKLDSAGNLTWNTLLGGGGDDYGYGVAVDTSMRLYVVGRSSAAWGSPVRAYTSGNDSYAARLDAFSGALAWNTFLGGSGDDTGYGAGVDTSGNVYVAGSSDASWGSPIRTYTSGTDAFAVELDSSGILTWSTFLGGSGGDSGKGIAVDTSGDVYVTGYSTASWGAPKRAYSGGFDAYAAKLNGNGGLLWNTFLGGTGTDFGYAIGVDATMRLYMVGAGNATWGSPIRAYTAGYDAFAVRLDAFSGAIAWSTFLGGNGDDEGWGIAVDTNGDMYVAGYSRASWGSPVKPYNSGADAFATKLSSNGNLTWSTFMGGGGEDLGTAIGVDSTMRLYAVGYSSATWGSPVRAYSSNNDAFTGRLDAFNGSVAWNTFSGGRASSDDYGYAIGVDTSGNTYVAGYSDGTWGSPVRAYTRGTDAFVAKLNSSGALAWNTFLGGSAGDVVYGIVVDSSGDIYVTGYSTGTWGSPVRAYTGGFDAFAAKLNSSGSIIWNTFLGGGGTDFGWAISVDTSMRLYVAGASNASWGSPARAYTGGYDAFVARLDAFNGSLAWNTFLGGGADDEGWGIAVDTSANAYAVGYSRASWGSPVRGWTWGADAFVARLDSNGPLIWNTFLGGGGDDYGRGIAMHLPTGFLFLTGSSNATWGAPLRLYTAGWDAFVAAVNPGAGLSWNTFAGGGGDDYGNAVLVENVSGNVSVAGHSNATWGSPVWAYTAGWDAFATKLTWGGGGPVWNTFLGGSGEDRGYGIAIDGNKDLYVAGYSSASWALPLRAYTTGYDAFVAKLPESPTSVGVMAFHAAPVEGHMEVTWKTGSEPDIFGFNLWRAVGQSSDFLRITSELIPAEGSASIGASYSFEDFDVIVGERYSYKLEEVDPAGKSTFHGPVSDVIGAITLVAPVDGATVPANSPTTFVWGSTPYDRFKLEFSKSAGFSGAVLTLPLPGKKGAGRWITGTSYAPNARGWRRVQQLAGRRGRLYWRVYGEDQAADACTSPAWRLTIQHR